MKKSISLTLLLVAGLMLFSIASCGGSSDRGEAAENTQLARVESSYDYEEESVPAAVDEAPAFKAFSVYTDGRSPDNHYVPAGYMGDYSDVKIDTASFENPHSGSTCVKIVYSNAASQGARWGGVYWQSPANNWGDRKGGFDLRGAKKLVFWARGEKGGERIEEIKMGGITGLYPDSDIAGVGPILLTTDWQRYEIDLSGKDLSYISGGFCWTTNLDVNPDGATFYLDDIKYE
ncbi:MAG: hypothetical protein WC569_01165 [Candidatus Omnitrophota bacterium]